MTVIGVYWDDLSKSFIPLTRKPDGHMEIDNLEEKDREPVCAPPGPEAEISDPPFDDPPPWSG